jgi:hypothetical protein
MSPASSKATIGRRSLTLFAIMVGALIGSAVLLVSFDDPNPPWSEGGLR